MTTEDDLPVAAPVDLSALLREGKPLVLRDDAEAEWAALQLRRAKARLHIAQAEVEEYQRRVTAWADRKTKALRERADLFERALSAFALSAREQSPLDKRGEPTVKSVQLPSARIRTRGGGCTVRVTDDQALADVLEEHYPTAFAACVEYVPKVRVSELRKMFKVLDNRALIDDDGTHLPHVEVTPTPVTAWVETDYDAELDQIAGGALDALDTGGEEVPGDGDAA